MLSALLGDGAALEPLRRLIIANTEGNPFHMEETVQVLLLDDDSLIRNGVTELTKPLAELKIPPTVQSILASRTGRLPAEEKDLPQTLAVIGKEFPLGLVRTVTGKADDELERMLRDEARAMLADIYGWFTEGFDTADLIDAKSLLDELNLGAN
jgi:predicted ATPase